MQAKKKFLYFSMWIWKWLKWCMYHNLISEPAIQYHNFCSNVLVFRSQDSSGQQSPPVKEQKTSHDVTHEINVKNWITFQMIYKWNNQSVSLIWRAVTEILYNFCRCQVFQTSQWTGTLAADHRKWMCMRRCPKYQKFHWSKTLAPDRRT